jgi:hypothetical protein
VLITVLVNGGASPYLLKAWDLFDTSYADGARSPPPVQFSVLPAHDDASGSDGHANGTNRTLRDFQRQGGLSKQFEQLDRLVSSYLIPPPSTANGNSEGCQVGDSLHALNHATASGYEQPDEQ